MTVRVRIRRADASDSPQLLPLARALATSFEVDATAFTAVLNAQLAVPTGLVLVAEQQTHIVGYALAQLHHTFHANGPVVWVEEVMVHSPHQGAGIGRALMNEIEAWGEDCGAAYIALATRRAASFYEALGYEPSATYFKRALPPRSP